MTPPEHTSIKILERELQAMKMQYEEISLSNYTSTVENNNAMKELSLRMHQIEKDLYWIKELNEYPYNEEMAIAIFENFK